MKALALFFYYLMVVISSITWTFTIIAWIAGRDHLSIGLLILAVLTSNYVAVQSQTRHAQ